MVDIRWIVKTIFGGTEFETTEKVLQFKSGDSDWQDVPVIDSSEPGSAAAYFAGEEIDVY